MKKIALGLMLAAVPLLSGCSLPGGLGGGTAGPTISFVRSSDGGTTFEPKTRIDEKTDFASAEVLSIAFDPKDTRHIFLGTKEAGMFASDNSGDSWRKIKYPPTRVYGLVIDPNDSQRMFATGDWQGRGKIYQSVNAGIDWNEVYTEPANGTVITSLAQNPFNTQVLYAGTSTGMIIRTSDGGATWKSLPLSPSMNRHAIWSMTFDPKQDKTMYILVDGVGVFVSDGEKIVTEPSKSSSGSDGASMTSSGATFLALDPSRSGKLYAGSSQGLLRSTDFGKSWSSIGIIESSKKSPIRAVAVNPKNSDEITYISALTLYKSTDGGAHWSTHQLVGSGVVSFLRYDSYDPNIVYVGFKK